MSNWFLVLAALLAALFALAEVSITNPGGGTTVLSKVFEITEEE